MEKALRVENLGKRFRHRSPDDPKTFRQWVEGGWRRKSGGSLWALRGVNFEVARGEMLGVVGRNGSGKSTLLRLLGGVMRPDEGQLKVAAPVNGLLELNTGMHPELSGRENIIISGVLTGLLKREIAERVDEIVAFAELGDHIEDPVRTYSSGMKLRLGFSVAVHVDPTILLIDEILAVGDLGFQQKCLARIEQFKSTGCAIVLISHDLHQIRTMCDRALWLDKGRMKALGSPHDVLSAYEGAVTEETARRTAKALTDRGGKQLSAEGNRTGSLEAELADILLLNSSGVAVSGITPGEGLTLRMTVKDKSGSEHWQISVTIADHHGVSCLDVNTGTDGVVLPDHPGQKTLELHIGRLDLAPGIYTISVGLWHANWDYAYDYEHNARSLRVSGAANLKGIMSPPRRWQLVSRSD